MAKNNDFGIGRTILQIVSGVTVALPIGICLYFMPIMLWAMLLNALAIPIALIPYASSQILSWMDFSDGVVMLLIVGAVIIQIVTCRILIRRHWVVFAYTQGVLGLAVSAPLYYWTIVHQRPLLPFWGQ